MTHRILVADDSPTIQKVIRIAFSRMEVEMVGAASLVEALSEASRSALAMIIVDAGLPGTRGPADFSKLKASAGNVPIVLLVGSYENIDEQAFMAAGLEFIIRKPFDSADLVKTCTGLLGVGGTGTGLPMAPSTANLPPPPPVGARRGDTGVNNNPSQAVAAAQPVYRGSPEGGIPEFDLGEAAPSEMFKVSTGDTGARQTPGNPTTARDIDLEQAIGSLGIPVIDMGREEAPPAPAPATESGRRGQRAFSEPMPDTSPNQPKPKTDSRASQHPATKTHYIPPPSSGGRGPTIAPAPFQPAVAPEELARLVREAVEDFCNRHFSGLAREIITAELRRLADDRARHLVDN